MSIRSINIGREPNDGTGDPIRTAFETINGNFATAATAMEPGIMSAEAMKKLEGIEAGAQKNPGDATTIAVGLARQATEAEAVAGSLNGGVFVTPYAANRSNYLATQTSITNNTASGSNFYGATGSTVTLDDSVAVGKYFFVMADGATTFQPGPASSVQARGGLALTGTTGSPVTTPSGFWGILIRISATWWRLLYTPNVDNAISARTASTTAAGIARQATDAEAASSDANTVAITLRTRAIKRLAGTATGVTNISTISFGTTIELGGPTKILSLDDVNIPNGAEWPVYMYPGSILRLPAGMTLGGRGNFNWGNTTVVGEGDFVAEHHMLGTLRKHSATLWLLVANSQYEFATELEAKTGTNKTKLVNPYLMNRSNYLATYTAVTNETPSGAHFHTANSAIVTLDDAVEVGKYFIVMSDAVTTFQPGPNSLVQIRGGQIISGTNGSPVTVPVSGYWGILIRISPVYWRLLYTPNTDSKILERIATNAEVLDATNTNKTISPAQRRLVNEVGGVDYNTLTTPGIYHANNNGSTNQPWSDAARVYVDRSVTNYISQFAAPLQASSVYAPAYRSSTNGGTTWSPWVVLANSAATAPLPKTTSGAVGQFVLLSNATPVASYTLPAGGVWIICFMRSTGFLWAGMVAGGTTQTPSSGTLNGGFAWRIS